MCGSSFSSVLAYRGGMGPGRCPRREVMLSSLTHILHLSRSANFFRLICKRQQISFSRFKYVNKHLKH